MSGGYVRLTKTSSSGGAGVTAVTGTAPVASSGGATPAISMPPSDTDTDGYLASTDWNTFNNKQDALVSGESIKRINKIDILDSGDLQTGFAGFRYNIQVTSTFPPAPAAPSGVAYVVYYDNGEGGADYGGWSISNIDADGNDIGSLIFGKVNLQPFSVFLNTAYCLVNVQGSTAQSGAYLFDSNSFIGIDPNELNGQEAYINFGTSQSVPTYNGYSMVGNLNGTAINVGTFFIGIGSSTSNATLSNRAVLCTTSQGFINNPYITTAGLMTGTMSLNLMLNGAAINPAYVIPTGSAAATYTFFGSTVVAGDPSLCIRIVQTTATSAGINQFGWTIK